MKLSAEPEEPCTRIGRVVGGWLALAAVKLLLVFLVGLDNELSAQTVQSALSTGNWLEQINRPGIGFFDVPRQPADPAICPDGCQREYDFTVAARSYFLNDQRIEFTGAEATIGVEAVARGFVEQRVDDWQAVIYGEIFLNQRFDNNFLTDYALRESFSHNFEVDTLEIAQLSIAAVRGDLVFELGKFVTPFGRYYGFSYANRHFDVPFIRSEAILPYETGAQLLWNPGPWRFAAAVTNGGAERDTNSSKAFIGRVGWQIPRLALGSSIKTQDGIGSESQKEFNSHIGIDMMIRLNRGLFLSTEVIYDEYGSRRPGLALDDITWGRSIYNRQLNLGLNQPISGLGYYVNLVGQTDPFEWLVGFGQFTPKNVGDPIHDQITSRGIIQGNYRFRDSIGLFSSVLLENSVDDAQGGRKRKGLAYVAGLTYQF